jgi:MFS family permease
LIIASAFPLEKQSLAGGIFNTLAQIGNSVGLTIGAVLAASVSGISKQHGEDKIELDGHGIGPEQWQLLKGFRATFWLCFAALSTVVIISGGGLRKAGKVGLKKD